MNYANANKCFYISAFCNPEKAVTFAGTSGSTCNFPFVLSIKLSVMSNLKTYFKKSVCALKNGFAYPRAIPVIAKAAFHAMFGNGIYKVSFSKIGRKWYCNVPGFPKELFEHTLMVGGASKFLEYYSRGETEIVAIIRIAKEWEEQFYCGMRLHKSSSSLTGGAFYKDPSGNFDEEIWLCPVTLFLLGRYPKRVFIYKINKNYLHCPIFIE